MAGSCRRRASADRFRGALAAAAAHRRVVERDGAAAARFEAAAQAIAAGLNHLAAGFVTALAGDANAILGAFAAAMPHHQIALANGHAIERAAAAAHAIGQHLAEILQRGARNVVVTDATNLHTALALFDLHGAAWHDAPIAGHRRGRGRSTHARGTKTRGPLRSPFKNRAAHSKNPFAVSRLPWSQKKSTSLRKRSVQITGIRPFESCVPLVYQSVTRMRTNSSPGLPQAAGRHSEAPANIKRGNPDSNCGSRKICRATAWKSLPSVGSTTSHLPRIDVGPA